MSKIDFNRAVPSIISQQQAEALALFYAQSPAIVERDEERFKFLGGFNDIFVSIGIALVVLPFLNFGRILIPFIAWGLAEYFTRIKKYSLPSIFLTVAFAGSTLFMLTDFTANGILYSLCFSLAALLHYWRFRLPIDVMLACAGVVCAILLPFLSPLLLYNSLMLWLMLGLGLSIFILAMLFDRKDKLRVGLQADVAFWLHCLAAPLIVHATMLLILGDKPQGIVYFWVFVCFTLFTIVALFIDRRVLVVSCLSYVGVALSALLIKTEVGSQMIGSFPAVILLIGLTILGLSIGWQKMRSLLLSYTLFTRFHRFFPPLTTH